MNRFKNKVVFISGAAKGQGAVEARMFGSEGAKVVITDILDELGTSLSEELRKEGMQSIYLHLDVTKEDQWIEVYAKTLAKFNTIDILKMEINKKVKIISN